jgi:hypothetical protein
MQTFTLTSTDASLTEEGISRAFDDWNECVPDSFLLSKVSTECSGCSHFDDYINFIKCLKYEAIKKIVSCIVMGVGISIGLLAAGGIEGTILAAVINKIVKSAIGFSAKNFGIIFGTCGSVFALGTFIGGLILFIINHNREIRKNMDDVHDLKIGQDIFEREQSSLKSVVDGNIDEDSFKLEKLDDLML